MALYVSLVTSLNATLFIVDKEKSLKSDTIFKVVVSGL